MSSTVDWEAVRLYLPDMKNGSCIVVHTQQLEVASLIVGQSHQVLELEQFSTEHSVCVFYNEVNIYLLSFFLVCLFLCHFNINMIYRTTVPIYLTILYISYC